LQLHCLQRLSTKRGRAKGHEGFTGIKKLYVAVDTAVSSQMKSTWQTYVTASNVNKRIPPLHECVSDLHVYPRDLRSVSSAGFISKFWLGPEILLFEGAFQ